MNEKKSEKKVAAVSCINSLSPCIRRLFCCNLHSSSFSVASFAHSVWWLLASSEISEASLQQGRNASE